MTKTSEVNMITRQMTPFLSALLIFELYPLVHFIFKFRDIQNLVSWISLGLKNTHLHVKDDIFMAVNIDTLFAHKIC